MKAGLPRYVLFKGDDIMAKRLKWGTIEYLQTLIDNYFETEKYPSITGLRIHIDMSNDCWKYYINDRWRTYRKSPEQAEEIEGMQLDKVDNEAFEELMEISTSEIISNNDDIGNDDVKALLSSTLKKAKDRIDTAIFKLGAEAKNPAYFIFYQKAALGYRETAPETDNQPQTPTRINIIVMPAPQQPQQLEVIEVKALDK
jgi:hypothetical protein